MLIRKIYYSLPLPLRALCRKIVSIPSDIKYYLTQPSDAMHPPKGQILIGSGDFLEQGLHQLSLLQRHIDIRPNHEVLDIGCGQGRTAVALTRYLNNMGRYIGIDIMPRAIQWCESRISKRHHNFRFHLIHSHNQLYQDSLLPKSHILLPFADASFDKCFLFSVFTHLTESSVRGYMAEINRVLRPNEYCLCTMFVYDKGSEHRISDQNDGMKFPYMRSGHRLMNERVEEANVAYDINLISEMVAATGLSITNYTEGYWKDWVKKSAENSFQDLIILRKL